MFVDHRRYANNVTVDLPPMALLDPAFYLQHLGTKADSFHPSTARSFYGLMQNKVMRVPSCATCPRHADAYRSVELCWLTLFMM